MPRRAQSLLVVILLLVAPGAASAASFDCAKASAADEKAVCNDCTLAQKDVKMATLYEVLSNLVAMGERGNLQDEQRAFLKTRSACGASKSCIAKAYDTRIGSLEAGLKRIYAGGPY